MGTTVLACGKKFGGTRADSKEVVSLPAQSTSICASQITCQFLGDPPRHAFIVLYTPPTHARTHELRILIYFKLCVLEMVCLPIRSISFFFTAVWYSVVWMYHDSWSKCPTGGHVGSFLSFAFTNNAMMNIPAYCPLSIYPANKVVCIQFCLQGKLIKGMCIWYLDRNCKSSSQYVWKCPLPWILYNTIVCLFCSDK